MLAGYCVHLPALQSFAKCIHTQAREDPSAHSAYAGVGKSSLINSLKLQEAGAHSVKQDLSEASQSSIESLASAVHGRDTDCQVCALSAFVLSSTSRVSYPNLSELFVSILFHLERRILSRDQGMELGEMAD